MSPGHSSPKVLAVMATDSLKFTVMLVLAATPVAPLLGTVLLTVGAASVVKLKVKSTAMLSGGSMVSTSVICVATTVVVQVSPGAKSALGLMVKVVGPPVTTVLALVTFRTPLVGQFTWNQSPATLTGSLKAMVRLLVTPVAPLLGMVLVTAGGVSTGGGPPPESFGFGEQARYTPPLKLAPKARNDPSGPTNGAPDTPSNARTSG